MDLDHARFGAFEIIECATMWFGAGFILNTPTPFFFSFFLFPFFLNRFWFQSAYQCSQDTKITLASIFGIDRVQISFFRLEFQCSTSGFNVRARVSMFNLGFQCSTLGFNFNVRARVSMSNLGFQCSGSGFNRRINFRSTLINTASYL